MRYKFFRFFIISTIVFSTAAFALPVQAQSCVEAEGSIMEIQVPSTILNEGLEAKVYLPPCYNTSAQHYPVLYLLHGMSNTADQWIGLGAASLAEQSATPFIVVFPYDRMETSFNTAFVNELVPFIDENFRTLDNRSYRAIGGLSYGGGWALHIGLSHPELFSHIGAHSPALFYGDGPNLEYWAQGLPADTFVSVDIGEDDPLLENSAKPIEDLLTQAGLPHFTFQVYTGGHTEDYWALHLPEYLEFYTVGWHG